MAGSKTSLFYKKNEEARQKRLKQQAKYNKTERGLKIRTAANAANRAKGTYGNGDGKDVAHKPGKEGGKKASDVTLQSPSKNRKSRLKIRSY
tara:strand:+ start:634 stop:909 length:276 start_codon:yes stop_codon:yes gene_type:complete